MGPVQLGKLHGLLVDAWRTVDSVGTGTLPLNRVMLWSETAANGIQEALKIVEREQAQQSKVKRVKR